MQILIFGKTPLISLAETEAVISSDKIKPIKNIGCLIDSDDTPIDINYLGGSTKLANLINSINTTDWNDVRKYLEKNYEDIFKPKSGNKLKIGLSLYGYKEVSLGEVNATGLTIKRLLKKTHQTSSRIIENKNHELNTAQVTHGKLLSNAGHEILIIKNSDKTLVCRTKSVQDIDSYASRDFKRPKRDSYVGMLPPKLAQTIINLADGKSKSAHLLDPFCGTGVLMQEGLLKGWAVTGSDLDQKMIDYSRENLDWLQKNFGPKGTVLGLYAADATTHKWMEPFDTIACETYLGRPLSSQPSSEVLNKITRDCDTIHRKFLENVAKQTQKGFRMCIAVPSWHINGKFKHLPTLDNLSALGYNRISFVHVGDKKLIYHRKGQQVARELVVLERT